MACLVALTGCTESVSQADFVRRADRVCETFRRDARPLAAPAHGSRLPRAPELRRLRKLTLQVVRRLRRLTPPRGDEGEIERYLSGIEVNARRVGQLAEAVRRRHPRRARALYTRLAAGSVAVRGLAREYGFKVCVAV